MTTKAAEQLYLAQHMAQWGEKSYAVFNPDGKPIDELPFILGFNNGGSPGLYLACLIAQDGTGMGSHMCSHESYMPHDLGIIEGSRSDRHACFQKHYPAGYRMDFAQWDDPRIQSAYVLNQAMAAKDAAK